MGSNPVASHKNHPAHRARSDPQLFGRSGFLLNRLVSVLKKQSDVDYFLHLNNNGKGSETARWPLHSRSPI